MSHTICSRCERVFTTDTNFERHLIIERSPGVYRVAGCADPATVVDKHGNRRLYRRDIDGVWSGPPMPPERFNTFRTPTDPQHTVRIAHATAETGPHSQTTSETLTAPAPS